MPRWFPLVWIVLWLSLASGDTETTSPPSPPAPSISTISSSPLVSLSPHPTPSPSPTLSGCQVCASVGDCSHAYHDGPGQFCGNWFDQLNEHQRCCCPRDATCKVSKNACRCSNSPPTARPSVTSKPRANNTRSSDSGGFGGGIVLGLALFMCCGVCVCCCSVRRGGSPQLTRLFFGTSGHTVYDMLPTAKQHSDVVYAHPGPVHQPYAMAPMAPAYHPGYPGYAPGPAYGYGHSGNGSGSALAAGGLGAAAGLATGMVIANSFGHHHHSPTHYFGGGGGGGYSSGGDYEGDSGGDSGGDFGGDF